MAKTRKGGKNQNKKQCVLRRNVIFIYLRITPFPFYVAAEEPNAGVHAFLPLKNLYRYSPSGSMLVFNPHMLTSTI